MISLRRRYRRARRGVRLQRFHVAMLLTIVVLAYAGVPHVARVVDGMSGYTSGHYEPKDTEREAWVQRGDESPKRTDEFCENPRCTRGENTPDVSIKSD